MRNAIYDEATLKFLNESDTRAILDELHDSDETIPMLASVLHIKARRVRHVVAKLIAIGLVEEGEPRSSPHSVNGRPQITYALTHTTRKAA